MCICTCTPTLILLPDTITLQSPLIKINGSVLTTGTRIWPHLFILIIYDLICSLYSAMPVGTEHVQMIRPEHLKEISCHIPLLLLFFSTSPACWRPFPCPTSSRSHRIDGKCSDKKCSVSSVLQAAPRSPHWFRIPSLPPVVDNLEYRSPPQRSLYLWRFSYLFITSFRTQL